MEETYSDIMCLSEYDKFVDEIYFLICTSFDSDRDEPMTLDPTVVYLPPD